MAQRMQGHFSDIRSEPNIEDEGQLSDILDPLSLDIPDEDLSEIYDKLLTDSQSYFKSTMDLYTRREKNEKFAFGYQVEDIEEEEHVLKDYESRFMDNVIYEIEATIKPLAMSRLPDLIVTPGQPNNDQSKLMADSVGKAVDSDIKSRQNRKVLGLAFKHLPVYLTSVIKARWDNELDDYVFECINPKLIDVDNNAPSNDVRQMKWISQIIPWTVQEVIMRFPKKEQEFTDELKRDGIKVGEDGLDYKAMGTVVKVREIWFTEYKKNKDTEWERIEGVMWKYYDVILGKMKNPNFDYEGEDKFFKMDSATGKRELTEQDMLTIMQVGQMPQGIKQEKVYHNYFDQPEKPYFLMGYDQWGDMPYDKTSRIEQNIQNQKALDKRGQQIEETLNNKGHHVFSKLGGWGPDEIEDMDHNDPNEDYLVDGNVNDVHKFIAPARPDASEFKDKNDIKDAMYGISGSNATRGTMQSDVATTNQIARESDFTRADDLVEDTINAAAEWMARWALQFIKLRYTEDHWKKLLGGTGKVVFEKLNRNMVEDGMEVMIKASGTDKFKAQNNAMDMAKMEMIDYLNFYRDMGYPDYMERAKQMIDFSRMMKGGDPTYEVKYIMELATTEDQVQALITSGQAKPFPVPQQGQPGVPGAVPPQVPPQGNPAVPAPAAPMPTPNTAVVPPMQTNPAGSV